MKCNDKELASLAHTSNVTRSGKVYLLRLQNGKIKGETTAHWARLVNNTLLLYKTEDEFCREPLFIVLLEYIDINLLDDVEISHAFSINFKSGDAPLCLAVGSDIECLRWTESLKSAGISNTLKNLSNVRNELQKLKTEKSQEHDSPYNPTQTRSSSYDNGVEIEVSCTNLKLRLSTTQPDVKDGVVKSSIEEANLCIHTYHKHGIEWKRIGQTEVVDYSHEAYFYKCLILTDENLKSYETLLFKLVDYRDLKKLTFYELGSVELATDKIKYSSYLTLEITPTPNHGPHSRNKDHREISTSNSGETPKLHLKINPRKIENQTLDLNSQQLRNVCENILAKQYCFHDNQDRSMVVYEFMGESKFCFEIPIEYIKFLINQANHIYTSLNEITDLEPSLEVFRRDKLIGVRQSIEFYELNVSSLISNTGPKFKSSLQRSNNRLDFVPTNLHANRIAVMNKDNNISSFHDIISVGVFTASSQGYNRGGLLRLASLVESDGETTSRSSDKKLSFSNTNPIGSILLRREDEPASESYSAILYGLDLTQAIREDLSNIECRLIARKQAAAVLKSLDEKMKRYFALIRNRDQIREQNVDLYQNYDTLLEILKKIISFENSNSKTYLTKHFDQASRSAAIQQAKEKAKHVSVNIDETWNFEAKDLWQVIFIKMRNSQLNITDTELKESSAFFSTNVIDNQIKSPLSLYDSYFTRRHEVVFSQCITSVITGLALAVTRWQFNDWQQMERIGIPLYFECLISCYGDEAGMLEDWIWVIEMLEKCSVNVVPSGPKIGSSLRYSEAKRISHGMSNTVGKVKQYTPEFKILGSFEFLLSVPWSVWETTPRDIKITNKINLKFRPIFLNIGINEFQTLSDNLGKNSLQKSINQKGIENLANYFEKFKVGGGSSKTVTGHDISSLIKKMNDSIDSNKRKNIELFEYASEISLVINAIRFTSCKSAKDRTAMSVTLEQIRWLQKVENMKEGDMLSALKLLRSTGVRLDNLYKNVKSRKYAFNAIQIKSLPKLYRPPDGTFSSMIVS